MKRELKFRAWDNKSKQFPFRTFNVIGEVTAYDLLKQYATHNIIDLEVSQYTGFKDEKGIEIYEGDIVTNPIKSRVLWSEYGGAWKLFSLITNQEYHLTIDRARKCVVIGNIYENPEMIKIT